MLQNHFKTKKFKELQAKWYKKLAHSGFVDAEDPEKDSLLLWHGSQFNRQRTRNSAFANQSYYRHADHFLNSHEFKSKTDKRIWTLHADGIAIRKIAQALRLDPNIVYKKIVELKDLMLAGLDTDE